MTPTTEQLKDLLAKVTPGEWRVDHSYQWPSKVRADPPFNDRWICDASVMPSAKDQSHTLHNATLIALAPTLAAEVVRLRGIIKDVVNEYDQPDNGRSLRWEIEIARQALDGTSEK